jgi:hypothetical protein
VVAQTELNGTEGVGFDFGCQIIIVAEVFDAQCVERASAFSIRPVLLCMIEMLKLQYRSAVRAAK